MVVFSERDTLIRPRHTPTPSQPTPIDIWYRTRNQRLKHLLATSFVVSTMGRPRKFGTSSVGMQALRKTDEMHRRRLKDGRVIALFPREIANQLDHAGLYFAADLRSKALTDMFLALPGAGPVKLREVLETVGRVEQNSDLLSAYRKARSIITS